MVILRYRNPLSPDTTTISKIILQISMNEHTFKQHILTYLIQEIKYREIVVTRYSHVGTKQRYVKIKKTYRNRHIEERKREKKKNES